MTRAVDEYSEFVSHPRYGQRPRITGLNPETDSHGNVFIHWHSPSECRVPNTAIAADLTKQSPATVPVTHYFDVKRQCRDCSKPFLFFAEEQKYWYEQLGFGLDSDCVRCIVCRKRQQGIGRKVERYQELFHLTGRTIDQDLEMTDCSLALVEAGTFHRRQLERIRILLKSIPSELEESARAKYEALLARLSAQQGSKGLGSK